MWGLRSVQNKKKHDRGGGALLGGESPYSAFFSTVPVGQCGPANGLKVDAEDVVPGGRAVGGGE